jgi:Protein ENHANCED DISEASE RESISTANCE 2, C-terminal
VLGGQLRRLPSLVVNFRFPWGVMALYFEIPDHLVKYMLSSKGAEDASLRSLSAPERLLAKWLQGDAAYRNDRLKLIPFVAEGPWVVRNMVTGRPAIIGKKLPVTYQLLNDGSASSSASLQPVLIATLDIGNSSATAKRIVSVCRRYMSALTVDIGFVLQGESPDELPEQMLGSVRVHAADPLQAPSLEV